MIMNGMPMAADLRCPVFWGWGFFVLALMPLAVFFPFLILPLLLSVAILTGAGRIRAIPAASFARPGRAPLGSFSVRAPPLV
jgi:hypothetical protein